MICGRNVFLKYGLGTKRLSEIWFGYEKSFWNMVWVRNFFLKYGFGCETSFWNMVWVRNVFLNYEDGGETSFPFMGRGRNVFPKYKLGAKRLTKNGANWLWGEKSVYPPAYHAYDTMLERVYAWQVHREWRYYICNKKMTMCHLVFLWWVGTWTQAPWSPAPSSVDLGSQGMQCALRPPAAPQCHGDASCYVHVIGQGPDHSSSWPFPPPGTACLQSVYCSSCYLPLIPTTTTTSSSQHNHYINTTTIT